MRHMTDVTRSEHDSGCERAFETFFQEHHRAVYSYVIRRASATLAHDVTAETFAIAWRRWLELPHDSPRPWLYGVARRALANARRSERRQSDLRQALVPHIRDRAAERDSSVAEALAALSEDDREALLLVAWEGLSEREAAAALGVLYATFRVRFHRARRRFRSALQTARDRSDQTIEPSASTTSTSADTQRSATHA